MEAQGWDGKAFMPMTVLTFHVFIRIYSHYLWTQNCVYIFNTVIPLRHLKEQKPLSSWNYFCQSPTCETPLSTLSVDFRMCSLQHTPSSASLSRNFSFWIPEQQFLFQGCCAQRHRSRTGGWLSPNLATPTGTLSPSGAAEASPCEATPAPSAKGTGGGTRPYLSVSRVRISSWPCWPCTFLLISAAHSPKSKLV